jgi:tetratricopeptide (TPR) repeat protein
MRCIGMIVVWAACLGAQEGRLEMGGAACAQLYRTVAAQAAKQGVADAERVVLAAAAKGPGLSCAGAVLTNLASVAAVAGRLDDAASLAERAIQWLEQEYSRDDPVLLRPLHLMAIARFEHGETARAREVFERMQSIRVERPEDRALVHDTGAWLLENQGRYREAESEYVATLDELGEAALGNTMDAGVVLNAMAGVYIKEQRLGDAKWALDRALAIANSATDAVPVDRMKVLQLRGVLQARRREWVCAEQDLREALAIADGEPRLDENVLASLLTAYARVLRKNHHSREARSIERRIAGLDANARKNAIVDVSELERNAARY